MGRIARLPWDPRRVLRLVLLGLAGVIGFAAWLLVPAWVGLIPSTVRQQAIDGFLQALLVGYGLVLVGSVVALPVLIVGIRRARRRGRSARRPARLLLLCGSCLIGLALIEALAAVWEARTHRLPELPRFPTLPERLARAPRGGLSIVVIGGSSALGEPYHPWLSIGQIVAWKLEEALPGRRVHLDILAEGGADLEKMHRKLARLTRRPDALIIYSGHNEFQAHFPWSRTVWPAEALTPLRPWPSWGWLDAALHASPFCRMIDEALSKNRLHLPPPPKEERRLVDLPPCSAAEYAGRLDNFRRRLEAIVADCERNGILPILVIPPGNDGDFEPNRSVPDGPLMSSAWRSGVEREFRAARALETSDPAQSRTRYEALAARCPRFAEVDFRLGRLSERRGDWQSANRHYVRARDADGFPFRCQTPYQDAYRAVAARHDVLLIDGPAILRPLSPHGIPNSRLFHDAHHPVLAGHVALAEAVLRALHARHAFGWRGGPLPVVSPAECAAHFGINADRWAQVARRTAKFFEITANLRYDPSERLARADRYRRAARAIEHGTPPEATGIPGLGVEPDRADREP